MTVEGAAFRALIESVADGSPIDWQSMEAAAADDGSRRRLQQLRLVAEVAAVHRTQTSAAPLDESPPSSVLPDEVGRWGHLLLLERIGEGTFGEVYRAYDPWLDREVALKLLKPAASGDPPTPEILREAQTLARVRHPNVVQVHGADVHRDRVGLWMELVRGQTLEELLASQGPFGPDEAAVIGQELCRALAAVHAAELVHCDIKATNVMREAGGRLVLMDFGAGQRSDLAATGPRRLAGTPLYVAPEVLDGLGATPRSDIYSLGVLLYRLVTGKYPVMAVSLDELREAHRRGDHCHLSDTRPDLPDAFVSVVERALSLAPDDRYASAGEMRAALASVLGSRNSRERRPVLAHVRPLIVALGVIGLCATLVLPLWRDRHNAASGLAGGGSVLAVLPFQNLSPDPGEAYLASAVPMELTARLGQIGALKVVPWTFMKRFDASGSRSLQEIAGRTGADAIVEGAVQRVPPAADGTPGPVQVRVQIFAAGTGTLLLTASFERDIGDFFALQAEIAQNIAARLRVVLAARDQTLVSRSRQVPPAAMDDYLRARHLFEIQMDLPGAIALFRRAADTAPGFAEAYVGLARCYALESAYFGSVPADVALKRALEASNQAISLDADMPEGWAARAFARFALEGDWSGAESDFKRALALGPTSVDVLLVYSNYLTDLGRHAEAIEAGRRAEERAPLSAAASRQLAWGYYMARQFDNAIRQARRTLEIEPGYAPARTVLGRALLFEGRSAEGLQELEAAGREYESMLALGYAMAGRREDAARLLDRMLSPSYDRSLVAYEIALVYTALDDQSSAMDWLERAYTRKDASMTLLAVDPMLDPLRDNSRFRALLVKVNPPR